MELKAIAHFESPFKEKFGIPRQSGVLPGIKGRIILCSGFSSPEVLRGLDGFDYLWLIWGFSTTIWHNTVRPPRLGGEERIGVFASRSPFRPNPLGLSSVKIEAIFPEKGVIEVSGADLMDGTAIYDIKPYVEYCDSHSGIRSGFADAREWETLEVRFPQDAYEKLSEEEQLEIAGILEQDPRPGYRKGYDGRSYGFLYKDKNIVFSVKDGCAEVTAISGPQDPSSR